MAAVDVVAIYESVWFGCQSAEEDLAEEPDAPPQQPVHRRGSSGSLSDAAPIEQADGKAAAAAAAAAAGRERRRVQAAAVNPPTGRVVHGVPRPHQNGPHREQEEEGVLGTWAGRQRIFSDHLRQKEEQERERAAALGRTAAAAAAAAPAPAAAPATEAANGVVLQARPHLDSPSPPVVLAARRQEPAPAAAAAAGAAPAGHPVDNSLDQELNAAWRWRFTRKWQAEQMKQFEAPAAAGPNGDAEDEEEWSAALRLMDAVDGGLNMQIGRTLSLHNSSAVESSMDQSLTLMSPGLSQCVLLDSSIKESPLRDEAAATTHIVSMARKAQHLRQHQQEIERQVNERWEAASGGGQWVAQHLPAVQIDSWSSFTFVLVRLGEQRSHRQKLLVRGRNGASEQQAFATTEQEAARVSIAHRLPGPRVELVATGRMEWQAAGPGAGQRRTLRIKATRLHPAAVKDTRLRTTAGASAVVVELTRASFPAGDFDIVTAD